MTPAPSRPPPRGISLQTKFAVLLALLGLSVVSMVGASVWSFELFTRSVGRPVIETAAVLRSLTRIKRAVEGQAAVIAGPRMLDDAGDAETLRGPGPADLALMAEHHGRITSDLEALERNVFYEVRAGRSTSRNLRTRLESAWAAAERWGREPTQEHAAAARAAMFDLHELIERMEVRILEGSEVQRGFEARMRSRLTLVLILALLTACLTGALGLALVGRWVLRPVGELRAAASRIAQGDFDHRIPVMGGDELGRLSAEVNHMAEMVRSMQDERVERERLAAVGEMVRRLAHNLRNPLAGIRGLAEVTRIDLPADSDLRENQERIISAVDRFERWLKELLGATSPMAVHPEPTAIGPWLEGVVEAHRPMGDLKGVRIALDQSGGPREAVFDARHVEQALVALITNAIDASPPGGTVQIETFAPAGGGQWEVAVADQGPGVPPELTERIFKPYFTTKRDGNGIGLAVAQQVVKAHGGRIFVEPGLGPGGAPAGAGPGEGGGGPGATFRVRMPLHAATPNGQDAAGAGANGGQDPRRRR